MNPEDKIIIALDGMDGEQAISFASRIKGLRWVKVGLELFVLEGPDVLIKLRELGLRIFLDLKFHDIPATMAGSCRRAAAIGAELITVHACAGLKALQDSQWAACEGAAQAGLKSPTLLAVTVLTSWDSKKLAREIGIEQSIQSRVEELALLASQARIGGCICSPWEAKALRQRHPLPFDLVTPGIRPKGTDLNDQARVMTPSEAIQSGASRLVIGRPVTCAEDPVHVFDMCCSDIASHGQV